VLGTDSVDWPAVGVLSFSILSGGLAMAWRLGSLAQRVKELERRVDDLTRPWSGRERRHMSPAQRARRQRDP
jgi:hypothetical protein